MKPGSSSHQDDLRRALAFALTFDGRKRFREAEELTARIAADTCEAP
jgi:hypothetical protein